MESKKISKAMLSRLPGYLDYLKSLPEDAGANISARAMAEALGLGDVLVRKDLARVSNGGRCKTGHQREVLIRDMERFLDYSHISRAVLVGAGKLGQALLCYGGFEAYGMEVLAGFDLNPQEISEFPKPIYPMEQLGQFCREQDVRIGIITVPAEHAQDVCDRLVESGVEGIWNFAPLRLQAPDHVLIQNENLAVSLTALRMQLKLHREKK